MRKKTESLTFPTDPLTAYRELQELDAPQPQPAPEPEQSSADHYTTSSTNNTVALPTGNAVVQTTGSKRSRTTKKEESYADSSTVVNATSNAVGSTTNSPDLMRQAMLTMLGQPLSADPEKGPLTVTSIKVHAEIWERLGWVAALTGRNKQDLVSEALQDLFEKVRRGEL